MVPSKIQGYDDLLCRQEAVILCENIYTICDDAGIPLDDEFACRWYLAALNISGKIAYAYGPEDITRFHTWLPVASKYAAETVFWSGIALQKGHITATQHTECVSAVQSIRTKIRSIVGYLDRYGQKEQHTRRMFFSEVSSE